MSSTIADVLTALVQEAATAAGHADAPVPLEPCVPTKEASHGDYQSNFAFRLGRALRTNPRAIAQALVDALPANPVVRKAEVAGPGFINFHLDEAWLASNLETRADAERFGTPQLGAGKTLVIDYSSPNVAKRMHIAHLRSTVIGGALHALYAFLGWRVVADNHIGDWGTPFGKLIVAWRGWRDDAAYAADPLGELQRLYESFKGRAAAEPELNDQARAETAKLQSGDADNLALWRRFVAVSMAEFDTLYTRLGIEFDVVHGESFYADELGDLVDELVTKGIAEVEEDGAVVVRFDPSEGKGLGKSPMLIRKKDGAALYATTDLATIRHRQRTWSPDVICYVTDLRQKLHFRQVFAGAKRWGWGDTRFEHVPFGILRFPDGALMSSRGGGVIRLAEVLDTARDRALALVRSKSPNLPESEANAVAEAVGVAAVRYFDLSQNPQSDITFDWERSLALDGNTAPYLMYGYARCQSVLRRAGSFTPGGLRLDHSAERELAVSVSRTPELIMAAASSWRPNLLCEHLYGMTQSFSRFWEQCPILKDDVSAEVRQSRLTLTHATARALEHGLGILGIQPVDRM
ncbi:MAG: arginyl-tRNA synthetase [Myxococcota bacterium]|jgi:arginyl-tRNA synthetase